MPSRKVCLVQEPHPARVEDEAESSDPGSRETANLSPCPAYATSPTHNRHGVESPAVRSASVSSGSPNDLKMVRGQYPSPEARSEWRKNMVRHCSTPELWPHANTPELWPTPECNQPNQHLPSNSVAPLPLPEEPEDRDRQWVWGEMGDAEPAVLPPGWQEAPKDDACYPPQWPVQNQSEQFGVPPPWAENGDCIFVGDEYGWDEEMVYDGLRRGPDGRWVRAVTRRRKPRRAFMSPTIDERSMMGRTAKLSWLGRIVGLAREPLSSRMMQRELRECASMTGLVTAVVEEIAPHFALLMNDPVGNYFCQALIDVACPQDLAVLLRSIAGSLVDIALSRHGTCAVQRLIHVTIDRAPDQTPVLTQALQNAVVRLTKDVHGHYVIQCCLDTLAYEASGFILREMRGSCIAIATHRQGCLVLQKCFDRQLDGNLVELAEEIAKHACSLSQDPFGNYVVQHVLKKCPGNGVQNLIAEALAPQLVPLSQQKFSSNVVELCFTVVDHNCRAHMIETLLNDHEGLHRIVKDPFGNYVVQSILSTARKPQLDRVVAALKPALAEMEQSPAGRRVLANLRKKCPHFPVLERRDKPDGERRDDRRRQGERRDDRRDRRRGHDRRKPDGQLLLA